MLGRNRFRSVPLVGQPSSKQRIRNAGGRTGAKRVLLAAAVAVSGLAGVLLAPPAAGAVGTWTGPVNVYGQNYTEAPAFLGMSCTSSTFCVGLDEAGYATYYDGSTWTGPVDADPAINGNGAGSTSVSCPTTSFCVGVDGIGDAVTYAGGKWGTPKMVDGSGGANAVNISSVSCPSITFCAAVDLNGDALTFDGTNWTAPTFVDNTGDNVHSLESVSCTSAAMCIAVDNDGGFLEWNGMVWTPPVVFDTYQVVNKTALESVSCPTPSFCAAGDVLGNALTFDGVAWTSPTPIDPDTESIDAVSCASATFCVAGIASTGGTYSGYVSYYDGTTWSAPAPVDTAGPGNSSPGNLSTISCPSITFCAAGDSSVVGNIFVYANTNTVPGAPTNVIAEPGDASASLTWAAPSQGACPITSYTIDVYTGSTLVTSIPTGTNATSYTVNGLTNGTKYTFTVAATNCDGTGPPSTASQPIIPSKPTTPAPYNALAPYRICDTRAGNPSNLSGTDAQCLGKTTTRSRILDVQVSGTNPTGQSSGGVPASGATAVILTVTATGGTTGGYLTVYPAGSAVPLASNLNYAAYESVPNLVEVALGSSGQISIFNSSGAVDVLVDVEGYVGPASAGAGLYNALTPARICDTRPGNPSNLSPPEDQCNTLGPLAAKATMSIHVDGLAGVPANGSAGGAAAVALNVTVTGTTAGGYLTVWPEGAPRPTTSNLNWTGGESVPDRVVVPVGSTGEVSIYNSNGSANVLVDVGGWYTQAGGSGSSLTQFSGITPARICDTRPGSGEPYQGQTLTSGSALAVQVQGVGGVPANATAVVLNVTVTGTTSGGYLTVWPTGGPQPTASDLNWAAGKTVPNLVIVKIGSSGQVSFFNSAGSTNVIADVVGWYQ